MAFGDYQDEQYDPYGYPAAEFAGGLAAPVPAAPGLMPGENAGYAEKAAAIRSLEQQDQRDRQQQGAGGGGDGGGFGGGGGGNLRFNFAPVPMFKPTMFQAPTAADALKEPGYEFRLGSGRQALERSAAAQGVLRTGGTLKDIVEYGQNFGAAEYNNVFNRAMQTHGARYTAEKDMFAPEMAQWTNAAQAERARVLAQYQGDLALEIARMQRSGGGGYTPPPDFGPEPTYPSY